MKEWTSIKFFKGVFSRLRYQESWEVNGRPQNYNYNSEQNPGTGHFTQVWMVSCNVSEIDGKKYIYIPKRGHFK